MGPQFSGRFGANRAYRIKSFTSLVTLLRKQKQKVCFRPNADVAALYLTVRYTALSQDNYLTRRHRVDKKMKSIAVLIALLPLITLADPKEPVEIKSGFITGNDYRDFSPLQKRTYAAGIIDGIFLAPFFSAPKSELSWIENCATGMTDSQVAAIFDKYLRDNPARWQESMHVLAWIAIKDGCKHS